MERLAQIPSWDWPPDAGAQVLAVLRDAQALESERLLAAELAGCLIILDDPLAHELLRIFSEPAETDAIRARAAISFGAALEEAHLEGLEDRESPAVTEATLARAQLAFRDAYRDPATPVEVRRRALEASVRSPEAWHVAAVRAAYYDSDPAWKLTAVFCMRFVDGFDEEILDALSSLDPDLLHEAIHAARTHEVQDSWPLIQQMIRAAESGTPILPTDPDAQRPLLLAAMEAAADIRPFEVSEILGGLIDSEDEEIAAQALDLVNMTEAIWGFGSEDHENEEYDDDGPEPTWH